MKRFLCLLFVLCFLPVLSFAEDDSFVGKNAEIDLSPVGRWTISSNYKTLHDNYMFSMTDLYIFEDGSVYRVSIGKKKKENELSIGYDNGVWIGDQNELMIRVGKDVYNANIDENGFLYLINNDSKSVKFVRVCDPEAII